MMAATMTTTYRVRSRTADKVWSRPFVTESLEEAAREYHGISGVPIRMVERLDEDGEWQVVLPVELPGLGELDAEA